jgi:hypothetical protein
LECGQSAGKASPLPVLGREMELGFDPSKVPPEIGWYLAGFADGEGSFNVVFRRRDDYRQPWKVSLCFNISQRDKVILTQYKRYLRCGTLRQREDGVWYYEVNNLNAILERVIPFFERFRFRSAKKKRDFSKFKKIASLLASGEHLEEEGIRRILEIRREMNDGGKRKFSEEEILEAFKARNPQRPYAEPPV